MRLLLGVGKAVLRLSASEEGFIVVVGDGRLVVVPEVDVTVHAQVARFLVALAVVPLKHGARLAIGVDAVQAAPIRPVAVFVHLLILADVVHLPKDGGATAIGEVRGKHLADVAVVSACAEVDVCHPRRLIFVLNREVHHGSLVRVEFAAKLLLLVRLLIHLHVLHGVGRHVGERRTHIAEEGFAVHENLTHRLALKGEVAVLVNGNAGQLLHHCGERSVGRKAQSLGVKQEGVGLHGHHAREGGDLCFVELVRLCRKGEFAKVDGGFLGGKLHIVIERFKAHHFGADNVFARLLGLEQKGALLVGGGVRFTYGVGGEQLHFHRGKCVLRTFFNDGALHAELEGLRLCREGEERNEEGE